MIKPGKVRSLRPTLRGEKRNLGGFGRCETSPKSHNPLLHGVGVLVGCLVLVGVIGVMV